MRRIVVTCDVFDSLLFCGFFVTCLSTGAFSAKDLKERATSKKSLFRTSPPSEGHPSPKDWDSSLCLIEVLETVARKSGVRNHRPHRRCVLPALLQKFVGDFFLFAGNLCGKFGGNFVEICLPTKERLKISGKFRSILRKKIRSSIKIFRAKFALQTCHLNDVGRH